MTVYKRKNVYYVESNRKDKPRVRMSTGAKTLKEARKFADGLDLATTMPSFELAVEFLRKYYQAGGQTPLADAWERYETVAKSVGKANVSAKTWRMRRERLAKFVAWCGSAHQRINSCEEVTGVIAADYAKRLADDGLKGKTRQNILGELSSIWVMLSKQSSDMRNPWTGLQPKADDSERGAVFTDDQVARILAAADKVGKGWPLACRLAMYTGLRYGDVANLGWSDVDLEHAVIRMDPSKTKRYNVKVVIPLHTDLVERLRTALESAQSAPEGSALKVYVLPNHAALYGDLGRGAYNVLNFAEVLRTAGIEGRYTFHSFRHYFRTKLAAAKVPTETAMKLCGHTNEAMSRHYDHDEHIGELTAAVTAAFA